MNRGATSVDPLRPIRRVAFTCDFFRISPAEHGYACGQLFNLGWLTELLTGASAWKHRGIEISSITPPRTRVGFDVDLENSAAFDEYRDDAVEAWARRYDTAEPDVFGAVLSQFADYDLVIGFEMAPTIRRHLHANGLPYINFYIHPLRFLRDLCLGATTNSPSINATLQAHKIAPHEIDSQVRRFRALFVKQQVAACAFPPDVPVLVGQTERDSVLIRNGRFAEWEDFGDELDRRLAPFDTVVFVEHPERANSNSIVEYLRSVHGKTVISTNANGYGVLFGNHEIPVVVTLASSLGVEARAAGHDAHFLLDDPRRKFIVPGIDLPTHGAYGHGVLGHQFWDSVFEGDHEIKQSARKRPVNDFALGEHYLRNSLVAWSYRPLQTGLTGLTSRKTLVPGADLTTQRRDSLLGGMAGEPTSLPLTRAIARAHAVGVQLEFLDPPLAIEEQRDVALDGPAAATYLARGFNALESWGGWSSELKSQLVVPVSRVALSQQAWLRISMRVRVFEGLLPQAPVLRITCEERLLGFVFFRTSGLNQQTISFDLAPSTPLCRIDMELTGLESPAAKGLSADQRWLGFALSQLRIVCSTSLASPELAPPLGSCRLWGIDAPSPIAIGGVA
ncbi:MAG: hypothetical protein Q8R33_04985 [Burkholderiales bacterium]|nr:hypothetical protein [Burkholderiales bacterium]